MSLLLILIKLIQVNILQNCGKIFQISYNYISKKIEIFMISLTIISNTLNVKIIKIFFLN